MTENILIFLLDNTLPDLPQIGTPKMSSPSPHHQLLPEKGPTEPRRGSGMWTHLMN